MQQRVTPTERLESRHTAESCHRQQVLEATAVSMHLTNPIDDPFPIN